MSSYNLPDDFLEMASNFHFLLYLRTNTIVEFPRDDLAELAGIVRRKDAAAARNWAVTNPTWGTFTILLTEMNTPRTRG